MQEKVDTAWLRANISIIHVNICSFVSYIMKITDYGLDD
jgi:hypothetical protein